ncbi:putative glucose-6-phosphate 1-dehydrogenase C7.13c [Schizosaccharomyces pombe]
MVTFMVFGASGNLANKKTFPALFHLFKRNLVDRSSFYVLGYARSKIPIGEFRESIRESVKPDTESKQVFQDFIDRVSYFSGQYDQSSSYVEFRKHLESVEKKTDSSKALRIFYIALPPSVYVTVSSHIYENLYLPGKSRLVIEKPFGKNYQSAVKLKEEVHKHWKEEEIYRIDHYTAKDMVNNFFTLRFANSSSIDAVLNRHSVQSVEIHMYETGGCEGRIGYYDANGVVRDVVQNHLTQIFCIAAMNEPKSASASDVRAEKVNLLKATRPASLKESMLGQYTTSEDGKIPGYLDLEGVPKDSKATTFAASTLHVDNDRWKGVPFVFVSGKRMKKGEVYIKYYFRLKDSGIFSDVKRRRYLILHVQPEEFVNLTCTINKPMTTDLQPIDAYASLNYNEQFKDLMKEKRDGYEILFEDAIRGDPTKFIRYDEVEYAWKIWDEILDSPKKPIPYPAGSDGPEGLEAYMKRHLGHE